MEEKQSCLLNKVIFSCLLISAISCQKKEEKKTEIQDDTNSSFSGKACYGSSISNQYILKWTDGSYTLFKGSKEALHSLIQEKNQKPEDNKIILAEQDRQFGIDINTTMMNRRNIDINDLTIKGNFWQVWGQDDVQANELWDKKIKGTDVTVAVIDGGVDRTHPSLINRIYVNANEIPNNGIDDDQNGFIDDDRGFDFALNKATGEVSDHGTHVAGIIAAEPKDSPMLGLAPESKILPLSIFNENTATTLATAANAIRYAEKMGVKIVNASWGGAVCGETLRDAIQSLADKGILFVTAAGNSGADIQMSPEYPAAFDLLNQITVGASVPSGFMASFSNYGYKQVHVLAPGHQILSTVQGGWAIASGTSMSAPFVSGLAALLWSAHPEAKMEQIKKSILQSVKDPQDYNPVLSKGRINAVKALEQLEQILKPAQ